MKSVCLRSDGERPGNIVLVFLYYFFDFFAIQKRERRGEFEKDNMQRSEGRASGNC